MRKTLVLLFFVSFLLMIHEMNAKKRYKSRRFNDDRNRRNKDRFSQKEFEEKAFYRLNDDSSAASKLGFYGKEMEFSIEMSSQRNGLPFDFQELVSQDQTKVKMNGNHYFENQNSEERQTKGDHSSVGRASARRAYFSSVFGLASLSSETYHADFQLPSETIFVHDIPYRIVLESQGILSHEQPMHYNPSSSVTSHQPSTPSSQHILLSQQPQSPEFVLNLNKNHLIVEAQQ